MQTDELSDLVERLRALSSDTADVEVKEAVGKLPASMVETLSAFSNGTGGTVVLGLSERDGFRPVPGFDATHAADALAQACADKLTPPVRASIDIVPLDGACVVVAEIAEMAPLSKPCYVTERGMYKGSFIRSFDGDRHLRPYEIDRLLEDRSQPTYDAEVVAEATTDELDATLVSALLHRQRDLHPRVFEKASDEDVLLAMRVVGRDEDGVVRPTLAGLLALGTYPQGRFPRLTVTFAAYPGTQKAADPRVKFIDSQKMVGPIPEVVQDTVAAVRRNTRTAGLMEGALRVERPDYPEAAVREAVTNALMHRDYSSLARGTQVQVNLYADRLEVLSPGGLYGTVTVETLGVAGYSSTRNQHLADILESVPYGEGFVAENRGTGYALMCAELERNGMGRPEARDGLSMFALTFRRAQHTSGPEGSEDVLAYVAAHPGCTSSELSQATGLSRSAVNYRLRKLVDEGRVARLEPGRSRNQRYRAM